MTIVSPFIPVTVVYNDVIRRLLSKALPLTSHLTLSSKCNVPLFDQLERCTTKGQAPCSTCTINLLISFIFCNSTREFRQNTQFHNLSLASTYQLHCCVLGWVYDQIAFHKFALFTVLHHMKHLTLILIICSHCHHVITPQQCVLPPKTPMKGFVLPQVRQSRLVSRTVKSAGVTFPLAVEVRSTNLPILSLATSSPRALHDKMHVEVWYQRYVIQLSEAKFAPLPRTFCNYCRLHLFVPGM